MILCVLLASAAVKARGSAATPRNEYQCAERTLLAHSVELAHSIEKQKMFAFDPLLVHFGPAYMRIVVGRRQHELLFT